MYQTISFKKKTKINNNKKNEQFNKCNNPIPSRWFKFGSGNGLPRLYYSCGLTFHSLCVYALLDLFQGVSNKINAFLTSRQHY